MATRKNSTEHPAKRQKAAPVAIAADPVVERGLFLRELWDAYAGAETEAWKAREENIPHKRAMLDLQMEQMIEWKNVVETEISFLLATSLQGAMIQLALAQDAMSDLTERLNDPEVGGAVEVERKIRRLLRSASDAVHIALGSEYPLIHDVVETYAEVADRQLNWLLMFENWRDEGAYQRNMRATS